MPSSKRWIFFIVTIGLAWLACDTLVYFYLKRLQSYRNIFYGIKIPDGNDIGHLKKTFHPVWGWDIKENEKSVLGSRKSRDYAVKPEYKIKAFGDSYTFSVTGDAETWCYFIEEQTGWDCLNYGVGGYGPDQALLKYRDIPVKSEHVILGILDENIGRVVTNWWGFYHKEGVALKPRYVSRNGRCELVPNPVSHADSLGKLGDERFIQSLKEHDYWQQYYDSIGAPAELWFPATFVIAKHFGFFSNYVKVMLKNYFAPSYESMAASKKFYHLYESYSEGLRAFECIIEEFAATASFRDERPLVLLFPIKHSVDMQQRFGRKPNQWLADYLSEKKIPFIDFSDVFVKEEYEKYYDGNGGHLSAKGNERVGEEVIGYLKISE